MTEPAASPPSRLWVGRLLWAAAALLVCLKLAVAAGAPPGLLAGASALVAAAIAMVAAFGPPGRWLDGWRAALLLAGLWTFPSVYPLLGGDGVEYYVLLRSPLFDRDLALGNDFAGFGYRAVTTAGGEMTSRVQIGMALVWMPLVLVAHGGAKVAAALGAPVAADGFSPIYQAAATASTFLFGFLALFLLEGFLRRDYGPAVALLSVAAVWFATPLHFYMVANPFMSHGASVLAATVFILAWLRARDGDDPRRWLLAGAAGGLMSLIRAHDSVLLLPPLLDLLFRRPAAGRLRRAGLYLCVPIVLAGVQLAVWRLMYGPGVTQTVAEMNFLTRLTPHVADLLFSARHGLFTWTPLYVAAVAGWLLWVRRDRRLALVMAGCFALAVFLNSLFADWWGSQAFGQRRLLSLTPLFAFGLAETVAALARHPLVPVSLGLALLALWNLQFEQIYNRESVASRREAISLDRLLSAQVEAAHRRLLSASGRLPPRAWALLYENLKGIWLDEGPRSLRGVIPLGEDIEDLPRLVGEGWYDPEAEQELRFRRSRGPRSTLQIPIRTPGDFVATLRARLEMAGPPVAAALAVNGEPVGQAELTPGWRDYTFEIPARVIRPGLNAFVLNYSATPRQADPEYHGRNAVLAATSLTLARRGGTPR